MKKSHLKLTVVFIISILLSNCTSYNLISEQETKVKGMKLIADKRISYIIPVGCN